MLRIERGQSLRVYLGDDLSLIHVHWTEAGMRRCPDDEGCELCEDRHVAGARPNIYAAAWLGPETRARLISFSPLAVPWAEELTDLQRQSITFTRAKRNNLLRSTPEGPTDFPTPAAPLDDWLRTLLGEVGR